MASGNEAVANKLAGAAANSPRTNVVAMFLFLTVAGLGGAYAIYDQTPIGIGTGLGLGFVLALILAQSPKVAQQWERAIVLRLGRYQGMQGPGLFWVIPFVDNVSSWIDQRVITTRMRPEG